MTLCGNISCRILAKTTKVKVHRPRRGERGVGHNALLDEGPICDAHRLVTAIPKTHGPLDGGHDGLTNVLLEGELALKRGNHLGVVLANDIECKTHDVLLRGIGLLGTAPLHRGVEVHFRILGEILLDLLLRNLSLIHIGRVAIDETLGGGPQLDGLGVNPTTTTRPTIELEGVGANVRTNVISLALELATPLDHHRNELLHLDLSFSPHSGDFSM